MADTVSAQISALLKVNETLDLSADIPTSPTRIHQQTGVSGTYSAGTTPPATKVWSDERTVTGTSETLDLTALVRTPLANMDMSGLKLQCLLIKAKSTNNASGLTFGCGASNGYHLWGGTTSVVLLPGQYLLWFGNDKAIDVDGTHKTFDVANTANDVYTITIVFG